MEEQICNYEIANKKEVANRLKDQLSLLKVSFKVPFNVKIILIIININKMLINK
jgi:hypothetical protein